MANTVSTCENQKNVIGNIAVATCRICYDEVSEQDLIKPCKCTGSIANVHKECLDMWIDRKCIPTCEICHASYPPTVNYKWWKVWNHPWITFATTKESLYLYLSAFINLARAGIILGSDVWIMILMTAMFMVILISTMMLIILIINFNRFIAWKLSHLNSFRIGRFQNYCNLNKNSSTLTT
ncbi:uncharacterized protein [Rhodnius prolixus]|uniref:uncharacterized protein n=1 Tax=Rhodnius prolixus TaxID=13249 RepID=UPI003D18CEB9